MVGYIAGHELGNYLGSLSMVLMCANEGYLGLGVLASLIAPWKCVYLRKRQGVKNETMTAKMHAPKISLFKNLGFMPTRNMFARLFVVLTRQLTEPG